MAAARSALRIVHGTPEGADPSRAIKPPPVGKRLCTKCGAWKPLREFHPRGQSRGIARQRTFYLTKKCRSCRHPV